LPAAYIIGGWYVVALAIQGSQRGDARYIQPCQQVFAASKILYRRIARQVQLSQPVVAAIEIPLLDHIIIAKEGSFSYNQSDFIINKINSKYNKIREQLSDYAKNPVNVLTIQGIINGRPDGKFDPKGTATRAEVAALVNRALNRLPENCDDLLEGMVTWPDNMNPDAWYYLYIQEATNSHYHEMKANGINETWTELITPREWWRLERPNSNPNIFTGADIGEGMGMDY